MSTQRIDPFGNRRFIVEIDNIKQTGFCEVRIPDSASEVIEQRQGTDVALVVRKQAGLTTYDSLILKWGLTSSMELYNWRKLVEQGYLAQARRNMSVILMDEEANPVAKWEFTNAWPSKYKAPDLNAQGNGIAIETLEIVFETMQRTQ